MIWDFCEVNPFSSATGGYPGALEWVADVMGASPISRVGQVESASATSSPLPDSSCAVWFTDPPYYDSVPYSYISDFFFVWLKRILRAILIRRSLARPCSRQRRRDCRLPNRGRRRKGRLSKVRGADGYRLRRRQASSRRCRDRLCRIRSQDDGGVGGAALRADPAVGGPSPAHGLWPPRWVRGCVRETQHALDERSPCVSAAP